MVATGCQTDSADRPPLPCPEARALRPTFASSWSAPARLTAHQAPGMPRPPRWGINRPIVNDRQECRRPPWSACRRPPYRPGAGPSSSRSEGIGIPFSRIMQTRADRHCSRTPRGTMCHCIGPSWVASVGGIESHLIIEALLVVRLVERMVNAAFPTHVARWWNQRHGVALLEITSPV